MIEVYPRLYGGDQSTCTRGFAGFSVVHACKSPCHQEAVGYRGTLDPSHQEYLAAEDVCDLYLNLIDPPTPLFQVESFRRSRDFAVYHFRVQSLLIHCNQGASWAQVVALRYLARLATTISWFGLL